MSTTEQEVEKLRHQMASMQARIDHLESHGSKLPQPPAEPRPNGALTDRLDATFHRRLDKLRGQLVSIVSQEYSRLAHAENLRDSLPSNSADPASGQAFVDAVPRTVAAMLTREDAVRRDLEGARRAHELRGGNEAKLARLQVELAAVASHTALLLNGARASLPMVPQALHHAIAALGKTRNQSLLPAHTGRVARV